MTRTIPQPLSEFPRRGARPLVFAVAGGIGLLTAGTVALWVHYGTAVFYETILAGINACF